MSTHACNRSHAGAERPIYKMSRQNTFTVIPKAPGQIFDARRSASPAPFSGRVMTSKQVKDAYKKATKAPTMTKAERRRWEKEEQERIRKEFEKEKAAAKARAARERKKEKELAEMEKKKKSGLPLVKVRPSQDTIARFVRGNGTGKKRDSTGSTVEQAEKNAIEEVTDESDARDTPVPEGGPVMPQQHADEETGFVVEEESVSVPQESVEALQEAPEVMEPEAEQSLVSVQQDSHKPAMMEADELEFEEDSQDMSLLEDALKQVDKIEQIASPNDTNEAVDTMDVYDDQPAVALSNTPTSAVAKPPIEEDFFGASLEDSALEAAFDNELLAKPAPVTATITSELALPPPQPPAKQTLPDELKDTANGLDLDLFSEVDDLELDLLDSLENIAMNATHKPITPPASSSKQQKHQPAPATKSPTPSTHPSKAAHAEPCFAKPAIPVHTPRKSPRLHSSSPASRIPTPPMSTQAILCNLDDLFPSSSQQARELEEEFPSSYVPAQSARFNKPPPARSTPYQAQPKSVNSPRFFTSSGGREQLSLALHRSRRSAAMEQLQQKERAKREAGLAIQQSKHEAKMANRPPIPVKAATLANKENEPMPASQESEYGGAWLDDIALDIAF